MVVVLTEDRAWEVVGVVVWLWLMVVVLTEDGPLEVLGVVQRWWVFSYGCGWWWWC